MFIVSSIFSFKQDSELMTHKHTNTHLHTFESQVKRRVPPKRGTGPRRCVYTNPHTRTHLPTLLTATTDPIKNDVLHALLNLGKSWKDGQKRTTFWNNMKKRKSYIVDLESLYSRSLMIEWRERNIMKHHRNPKPRKHNQIAFVVKHRLQKRREVGVDVPSSSFQRKRLGSNGRTACLQLYASHDLSPLAASGTMHEMRRWR